MTDGNINGEIDNEVLYSKVYSTYKTSTNIFVGFGQTHDNVLLKNYLHSKGEYYFIESLENAGMVYGEVLYNSIYESISL